MGELSILSVADGDMKITFTKDDAAESIRAQRVIEDMLKRGYALLVEVERDGVKAFERAQGFDPATGEYLIADFDPAGGVSRGAGSNKTSVHLRGVNDGPSIDPGTEAAAQEAEAEGSEAVTPEPKRRGRRVARVPAHSTRAVGIARSAGG